MNNAVLVPDGIKAIQHAANLILGSGLVEDGIKGPRTDAAFESLVAAYDAGVTAPSGIGPTAFALALASVAESQIGTQEDAAHSNRGSAILKYQQATSLAGQGWPWCAAFVDWCFKQAALQVNPSTPRPKVALERPQTASAFGLIDWATDEALRVFLPDKGTPLRGDIVVYKFSHTGIVTGYTGGTAFQVVEGNTDPQGSADGYSVARRTRQFSSVKAFIRI